MSQTKGLGLPKEIFDITLHDGYESENLRVQKYVSQVHHVASVPC